LLVLKVSFVKFGRYLSKIDEKLLKNDEKGLKSY